MEIFIGIPKELPSDSWHRGVWKDYVESFGDLYYPFVARRTEDSSRYIQFFRGFNTPEAAQNYIIPDSFMRIVNDKYEQMNKS